jgi:hypothetical protein
LVEAIMSRTCPQCQSNMSDGFIIDIGYGGANVSSWQEGEPRKSRWLGVRPGDSPPVEITTWRCDRCGFLESYAL